MKTPTDYGIDNDGLDYTTRQLNLIEKREERIKTLKKGWHAQSDYTPRLTKSKKTTLKITHFVAYFPKKGVEDESGMILAKGKKQAEEVAKTLNATNSLPYWL